MDKFFSCIKFLGVCFLVYTCLRLNHWVLAFWVFFIGGFFSDESKNFISITTGDRE